MSERTKEQAETTQQATQSAGEMARQAPTKGPPSHEQTEHAIHGHSDAPGAKGDPQFGGKPLSYYDRFATADDLKGLDGIGDARAHEIIAARRKRDRAK